MMKKFISALFSLLILLSAAPAGAYVIPAFPVQQAFPHPKHPTPVTLEEGQIQISAQGDTINVVSQLVVIAKYQTAIALEMSSTDIRQLVMHAGQALLEIKEMPLACAGLDANNKATVRGGCYYQATVKLPANKPIAITSRYQLKPHSGSSASSLYGDTLPNVEATTADLRILSAIPGKLATYAVTLKGLNRWPTPPKHFKVTIKGAELQKRLRDLSPNGWTVNNDQISWSWDSAISPLPALDIAFQTLNTTTPQQEEAIYRRLPSGVLSPEAKDLHLLALKRFHSPRNQYLQALESAIKKAANPALSVNAANDPRFFLIPEHVAVKSAINGKKGTQTLVNQYTELLNNLQENLLLEGLDLGPSSEVINILQQLLAPTANFRAIN